MGSWYAVERFVHAVRESGNPNITCWYEPGDTTFTFANGQIGKAEYKLAIQFQTSPPCCTYVDILDQGKVPILFSIEQMRNLNVTILRAYERRRLHDLPILSGLKRALLPMARSGHAMLDLTSFVRQDTFSAAEIRRCAMELFE